MKIINKGAEITDLPNGESLTVEPDGETGLRIVLTFGEDTEFGVEQFREFVLACQKALAIADEMANAGTSAITAPPPDIIIDESDDASVWFQLEDGTYTMERDLRSGGYTHEDIDRLWGIGKKYFARV